MMLKTVLCLVLVAPRGLQDPEPARLRSKSEEFRIDKVDLLDARFGRKPDASAFSEGESVHFRVALSGLQEKDHTLSFALDLALRDKDGRVLHESTGSSTGTPENLFGNNAVVAFISMTEATGFVGTCRVEIKAHDRRAGKTAKWEGQLTFEAARFGIYNPHFSLERDAKSQLPPFLMSGSQAWIRYKILGLTGEAGRIHVRHWFEIHDAEKGALLFSFESADPSILEYKGKAPDDWIVGAYRVLTLGKPGRYICRIAVEDKVAGKKTHRDVPFRVVAPDDAGRDY